MSESINISIKPEPVFALGKDFGNFVITNSMLSTLLICSFLCIFATIAGSTIKNGIKVNRLQNLLEAFFSFVEGFTSDNLGSQSKARKYIGLSVSLFLFVLLGSWFGLLPLVAGDHLVASDVGFEFAYPLFRAPTTDINACLAIALISFLVIQYAGFNAHGFKYLGKFFTFKGGPIGSFVGILELISEFSKLLSFSFRIFGNIFAGEVLLLILFFFTKNIWLPFPSLIIAMEVVVAIIQSYVLVALLSTFIGIAVESHDDHDHKEPQLV